MFYSKKSVLLFCVISIQTTFCMESKRSRKKQKTENLLKEKTLEETNIDNKLEKLPLEEIKVWKEANKFEDRLIAFKANLYTTKQGLFDGIRYALIPKGIVTCELCDGKGYGLNIFFNKADKHAKLDIVLCDDKFSLKGAFFKARLLTIEEVKRISDLINTKEYILGQLSLKDAKFGILKLGNLLPGQKRKYLYNKLSSVRLILIGARDRNSQFSILPRDIYMIIIGLIISEEEKDDSLKLEL